ncbi:MAG TPA: alpha/beta fold hydrolase [Pyrinomonadaceae bacterium]|jgi:pimeloyl-ACP methyl ester carboxylesterase|nr:alpha/beta fold hydrolase [Pyrinomonadaceae bacterium]
MKKILRRILLLVVLAAVAFTIFWYARPADLNFEEFRAAMPHASASRFAEVGGVRVHYQERGTGDALVLIHGNNSSAYSWRDVFDELAKEFRVVALDLKGFGFTAKPEGDYRLETQAALVIGLLDQLKIERATLCGSSMGGGVALATASNYPQRVRSLILVDSSAFTEGRVGASLAPAYVRWPYIGGAVTALALTSDSLVRDGLRKSFYDESKVTTERVEAYYRPLRTRDGQRAARLVRDQRDYTRIENSLDKIHQPTLIIWGAQDELILLEDGKRLHSQIAGSQLVVFDDCGHLPQEEMPQRFAREVSGFMKKAAPQQAE